MRITIAIADEADRARIYAVRHQVYARELGQHPVNAAGRLSDRLDLINTYVVARSGTDLAGFVSITPPGAHAFPSTSTSPATSCRSRSMIRCSRSGC